MSSIWGRRVDAWVTGKQRSGATREDYNRAGLNALWQIALVVIVAFALLTLARGIS